MFAGLSILCNIISNNNLCSIISLVLRVLMLVMLVTSTIKLQSVQVFDLTPNSSQESQSAKPKVTLPTPQVLNPSECSTLTSTGTKQVILRPATVQSLTSLDIMTVMNL